MSKRSKQLIAALAVIALTLLQNILFLSSGCDSMMLMLVLLIPFGISVWGTALYFLYWDPPKSCDPQTSAI